MSLYKGFAAEGRWYRGCCHTHTTFSDGKMTPEQLTEGYRKLGYDFVALTDHYACHPQKAIKSFNRPGFLVISGAELHPPTVRGYGEPHHLAILGLKVSPKAAVVNRGAESVIRFAHSHGALVVYAHPAWNAHDIQELLEAREADGVEVFNSLCEIDWALGHSPTHVEQALGRGLRWKLFASDDTHGWEGDFGRGWIMVKAKALTERAILKAIGAGHTYASSGPQIKMLSSDGKTVKLKCSPVKEILWRSPSRARGMVERAEGGKLLTQAEFTLKKIWMPYGHVRCEITDTQGRKAWSNPIRKNPQTGAWED